MAGVIGCVVDIAASPPRKGNKIEVKQLLDRAKDSNKSDVDHRVVSNSQFIFIPDDMRELSSSLGSSVQ